VPFEARTGTDGNVARVIFSEQENFLSSFFSGVAK
jgi:hypothetical protein